MAGLKNIIARIKAVVTADNKDFKKKMKDTERTAKKTGKSTGASFKKMSGVIKAAMSAAIVMVGVKMVGAINKLTKEISLMSFKANAVFGLYKKGIEEMAEETAAAMGQSKVEFINAAAGIQDLLIPMGFARKQATEMTKELVALSGALSAWTGGQKDATQVSNIIARALLAEREQLKILGISLTEFDIMARLAEKGQKGLTGATLAQAKAVASLELITEKSVDAQAAYVENQENFVIVSAQASANIKDVADSLTIILKPATEGAIKILRDLTGEMAELSGEMAIASESKLLSLGDQFIAFFGGLGLSGAQDAAGALNYELSLIPARLRAIDQMIADQKPLDEQLEFVDRYGKEYLELWKRKYSEWKKQYMRDQREVAAAEKQFQIDRLAASQRFYWALEGQLMAHNEVMRGLWSESNNAQSVALKQTSEGMEAYHTNLGLIIEDLASTLPMIQATTTAQEEQSDKIKLAIFSWNSLFDSIGMAGELMNAVSMSMVRASEETGASFADVAKAGLNSARMLIKAYIAEGVAAAVKSALINVPFPFNVIAAGLAGGGAAALFGKLVPSFAEGGMVTGPTLAMVGDNPSGKEMIIPWEKLGELGGGEVNVVGVLKGTDMYLQNQRFSEKLARTGRA